MNIGSTVTVDMGGRERVFTIVGGAESDVAERQDIKRVARGRGPADKKGDLVEATGPTGREISMNILKSSIKVPAVLPNGGTCRRCGRLRHPIFARRRGFASRNIPYGDFLKGARFASAAP